MAYPQSGSIRANWQMDGVAGSVAKKADDSGNNFNLTEYNSPISAAGQKNDANGAYEFDGTDQYLKHTDAALGDALTELTVSIWIKPDSVATAPRYFYWVSGSGIFALTTETEGKLTLWVLDAGVVGRYSAEADLVADEWQHFVGVWTGSKLKIYKNGYQVGADTDCPSTRSGYYDKGVYIAAHDSLTPGLFYDGKMALAVVWDKALIDAEILGIYNDEKLVPPAFKGSRGFIF